MTRYRSLAVCLFALLATATATEAAPQVSLKVEEIHAWRPPFGIDRVGQSRCVAVEVKGNDPLADVTLTAMLAGKEVAKQPVSLPATGSRIARVTFEGVFNFDEVVLSAAGSPDLARLKAAPIPFEAAAIAQPEHVINPVDLGAILVPTDWLLLGPGQTGKLLVRAIERGSPKQETTLKVWFESAVDKAVTTPLPLTEAVRSEVKLGLPAGSGDKDVLHVSILDSTGKSLWDKSITTMRVAKAPELPRFGAVEMKLRYDAPISLRDPKTGKFSSMPFEGAWDAKLNDVVVSLPNGSRYVFWRGSCYIPFWAGQHNTGLSYEWAERTSGAPGSVDCVEPLMDKELRYGRVQVVESTPARIHIRWTYQSTDLMYQVWGDQAVEDYYFYPDGYGTRTLNLKKDPAARYEISEFIAILPQETYPLNVLTPDAVDILYLDGEKRTSKFPWKTGDPAATMGPAKPMPAMYRIRIHKDDEASPIYFNSRDVKQPEGIFGNFNDGGQLVTPAYWGSHWPLARGNATGYAIDDRVHVTPCHTSLLTWGTTVPEPVEARTGPMIDSTGKSRLMTMQQWVWLIGLTADKDDRLLQWANSFGKPPTLEMKGAHADFGGYSDSRRASCIVADEAVVNVKLIPAGRCVNPVLEIDHAGKKLKSIKLADAPLDAVRYAWDGRVLWLDQTFDQPVQLSLEFE